MGREYGRSLGLALALGTPGAAILAGLFAVGSLDAAAALTALAVLVAPVALLAVPLALSLARARVAIERLGPEETAPFDRERRLSLAARLIWPAVLRLRRAWRAHAARAEARLVAAEAVVEA